MHLNGSSALAVAACPIEGEQARAEEFRPRSTIHRPFERFQGIDLSFRLAVASGLGDRIFHASMSLCRVRVKRCIAYSPDCWASFSQTPSGGAGGAGRSPEEVGRGGADCGR